MTPHYSDEHIKDDFESIVRQAEEERLMQDEDRLYEEAERMDNWLEMWENRNY